MEKKSTPAIRFKGFTDPWEQRKLGDVADIKTGPFGSLLHADDYVEDGTPIVTTEHFKTGILPEQKTSLPQVSEEDRVRLSQYAAQEGDILFSRVGSVDINAQVLAVQDGWLFSGRVLRARPDLQLVISDYLHYELATDRVRNSVISRSVGGTMESINTEILSLTPIVFPRQLDEQRRIGTFFRKLDDLITLHQRKLEMMKSIKKSMLEKMFPKNGSNVPEIRFAGFTDPWEQRKLGEVGEIITGSTPSTSNPDYYSNDGMLWVTPTDIKGNVVDSTAQKLSTEGAKVGRVAPANTILVTCIASIGKNALLLEEGSFNQQINGLIPDMKYNPYFLLTQSELWSAKMKSQAASGTMQIVNKTEFANIDTLLPSQREQRVIGTYFRELDNLITLHQRKLDKLKDLKKSMLEKMFV